MDILKDMGVSIAVGNEEKAQQIWHKFLQPFGYTAVQAFAPNWKVGTDRVKGTESRNSTVINHIFSPTYTTYTYYATDDEIPLYTRTRGTVSGNLVLWAGVIGMLDVIGSRFPSDDPKKNTIQRRTDGRSTPKEIIRAHNILRRTDKPFNGETPPTNWTRNLNTEQQEEYLEQHYPEYHKYLIENLHQPIEANDFLNELKVTKDRASFVAKINELVNEKYPDLRDQVFDDAVALDNDKWQLVLISNEQVKPTVESRGFKRLTDGYYFELKQNPLVPANIKKELEKVFTNMHEVIGEDSEFFIRTPKGKEVKKSKWINEIKGDRIMKEEEDDWFNLIKNNRQNQKKEKSNDDWEVDDMVDPITGGMPKKVATALEEMRGATTIDYNRCCYNMKELFRDYLDHKSPSGLSHQSKELVMHVGCDIIEKQFGTRNEAGEKIAGGTFNVYDALKNNRQFKNNMNIFELMSNELKFNRQDQRGFIKSLDIDIPLYKANVARGIDAGAFTVLSGSPDLINRESNTSESASRYWNGGESTRDKRGRLIERHDGASFAKYWNDCKKAGVSNPRMGGFSAITSEEGQALGEDIAMTKHELNILKDKIKERVCMRAGNDVTNNIPLMKKYMTPEELKLFFQDYEELASDGKITLVEITEQEEMQELIAMWLNHARPKNKQIEIDRNDDTWRMDRLKLSEKERLKLKDDPDEDSGGLA
jgi:hypothetical protein